MRIRRRTGDGAPDGERLLWVLLLVVVLGQRLALPFTSSNQIPLILPVSIALICWGLATGRVLLEPVRVAAYAVAMCGAALVLGVDFARGLSASLFSYLYLLATYLPIVVRLNARPGAFERTLDRYAKLMTVLAVVGIAQFLSIYAGLHYVDWPAKVIPASWLLLHYNIDSPLHYGSHIYRATAWISLEPSFYSQFLALGLLASVWRGRRDWAMLAMLTALVMSVSGTGVVMLIGGLVTIWVSRHRSLLRMLIGPLVVGIAVVLVSPLGSSFTRRASEGGGVHSSSGQRFVIPYTYLLPIWSRGASRILFGLGPGSSDRLANRHLVGLLAPLLPKVLLDYGALAGALLVVAVVIALARGPAPPLTVALLLSYTVLNEALLQPLVVLVLWAFTAAWTRSGVPAGQVLADRLEHGPPQPAPLGRRRSRSWPGRAAPAPPRPLGSRGAGVPARVPAGRAPAS